MLFILYRVRHVVCIIKETLISCLIRKMSTFIMIQTFLPPHPSLFNLPIPPPFPSLCTLNVFQIFTCLPALPSLPFQPSHPSHPPPFPSLCTLNVFQIFTNVKASSKPMSTGYLQQYLQYLKIFPFEGNGICPAAVAQ